MRNHLVTLNDVEAIEGAGVLRVVRLRRLRRRLIEQAAHPGNRGQSSDPNHPDGKIPAVSDQLGNSKRQTHQRLLDAT
jgi:hypothetical protein